MDNGRISTRILHERKPWIMENYTSHVVEDLLSLAKTLTVDLPLTGTQWVFGTGTEEAMTTSAWQGYDAGVRALTSMIDTLYRLPLSGVTFDRAANVLLRWQCVSTAISRTMFMGLWHTVGAPTTTEMQALEQTVAQCVTTLRTQRDAQELLLQLVTQLARPTQHTAHAGLHRSGIGGSRGDKPPVLRAVTRPAHLNGH